VPGRGWRTADGGYKSADGGWRAPYRPYDTGEWHRDQGPDGGPTSTGDTADYSSGSGEVVRHRGGSGGEYRGGSQRSRYPDSTGEIEPYRGGAPSPRSTGEIARYSATPGPRVPESPRYPAEGGAGRGYTTDGTGRGYTTDGGGRGYTTDGTGRGYTTDGGGRGYTPDGGRGYTTDGTGRGYTPDGGGRGYTTDGGGWVARPGRASAEPGSGGRMAADPGEVHQYPPDTIDTTRIPRQSSSAGHPAAPSGRREDAPELYTHDPLTLAGGESPAMRYDPATESYHGQFAEPPMSPSGGDPRRSTGGDLRARDAGVYGRPPRPIEWAPPAGGQDISARQPADRRYQEGPARRPPGRPQQRFEGTYPARPARNPRNIPPRGRPAAEDERDEPPGYFHTALVTTAWYTIPLLLYTMYVLTLDGSASAGDGQSARENALNGLLGGMPRIGVALVTSLAVALLIRAISRGWRAATIGFASAVVGAGAATVIFAAMQ
jgi:hypothetical protein